MALLGKMFALAIEWSVQPDNPARGIKPELEDPRDRWLWPDEIRRMFESLNQEHDPIIRGALSFILSTGARRGEALSARWTDIDFDAALWRIPKTKSKNVQTIPISGHAMGALQSLPRVDGYPWVIPGRAPGKPLVNLSKPWQRVRKSAGLEDTRIHDLRQSFGSMMVHVGASLYVAQRELPHSDSRTTADVYGVLGDDPLGAAFEAVGEKVATLTTNKYAGAMPKRSVDAFRPEGLAIGRCFYSETDIDSIIEVAGGLPDGGIEHTRANESGNPPFWTGLVSRREALVERLHWAVQSLDLNLQFQTKSTSQQLTDAFDKVENAAARLLKALCLPRKIKPENMLGSMPPALSDGLEAKAKLEVQAAVNELGTLWMRTAYVPGEGLDITGPICSGTR